MPAIDPALGQGRGMTETTAAPARPNTREMVAVHQVFRDAFGCAAPLVGSASGENPERVALVASFYANVLAFLHAHHQGEDELIWPKLVERAPADAALVMRIA